MYIIETKNYSYTIDENTLEDALLRFVKYFNPSSIESGYMADVYATETMAAKVELANKAVNNMIVYVYACVTLYKNNRGGINVKPKHNL